MKIGRVQRGLLVAFALAMVVASAEALVVTSSANNPGSNFIMGVTNGQTSSTGWQNDSVRDRDIAQKFSIAGTGNEAMGLFSIKVASTGSDAANSAITMSIYDNTNSATDTPGPLTGGLVYSGSANLPSVIGGDSWLTFNLQESLVLKRGNYYTVVLSLTDTAANRNLSIRNNNNDVLGAQSLGMYWDTVNSKYVPISGSVTDFLYSIQIPEPASMGLMALGGLVVMVMRKRFNKAA